MKIIFTGLPYFGKKLVKALNQLNSGHEILFYDTYYSKRDQLKFLFSAINADLVVSFNGAYSESKSLDWALALKKKIVMQWHGTDVQNVLRCRKENNLFDKYILKSVHFTDSDFLLDELKEAGIKADLLDFKYVTPSVIPQKKAVKVLSYVAQNREEFYGFHYIVNLALQHPELEFEIVGLSTTSIKYPENIKILGWLNKKDFNQKLSESGLFLRLTKHDGMSLSVLDALSYGCEVIWNQKLLGVTYVGDFRDLDVSFENLVAKLSKEEYKMNTIAVDLIKKRFDKEMVLNNYLNKLVSLAE